MTTIHWLDDGNKEGGVAERQFVIKGGKVPVPGIIWSPDSVEAPVPELFSRESQCDLFDLIGSEDKRLIAYPGPHGRSTPEAVDVWCRFLEGHLSA